MFRPREDGRVAILQAQLGQVLEDRELEREQMNDLLAHAREEFFRVFEAHVSLQDTHHGVVEELRRIADENRELRERIEKITDPPIPPSFFGNQPISVSEEEQDLQFQLDTGLIGKVEFDEGMQNIDFVNSVIDFAE